MSIVCNKILKAPNTIKGESTAFGAMRFDNGHLIISADNGCVSTSWWITEEVARGFLAILAECLSDAATDQEIAA